MTTPRNEQPESVEALLKDPKFFDAWETFIAMYTQKQKAGTFANGRQCWKAVDGAVPALNALLDQALQLREPAGLSDNEQPESVEAIIKDCAEDVSWCYPRSYINTDDISPKYVAKASGSFNASCEVIRHYINQALQLREPATLSDEQIAVVAKWHAGIAMESMWIRGLVSDPDGMGQIRKIVHGAIKTALAESGKAEPVTGILPTHDGAGNRVEYKDSSDAVDLKGLAWECADSAIAWAKHVIPMLEDGPPSGS